jgi:hypothetical protein
MGTLAEALDMPVAKLTKLIATGGLSSDALVLMADVLHEKYGPAAEAAGQGAIGTFTKLSNAIREVMLTIGEAGLVDFMADLATDMTDLAKAVADNKELWREFFQVLKDGKDIVKNILSAVGGFVADTGKALGMGMLSDRLEEIDEAIKAKEAMLTHLDRPEFAQAMPRAWARRMGLKPGTEITGAMKKAFLTKQLDTLKAQRTALLTEEQKILTGTDIPTPPATDKPKARRTKHGITRDSVLKTDPAKIRKAQESALQQSLGLQGALLTNLDAQQRAELAGVRDPDKRAATALQHAKDRLKVQRDMVQAEIAGLGALTAKDAADRQAIAQKQTLKQLELQALDAKERELDVAYELNAADRAREQTLKTMESEASLTAQRMALGGASPDQIRTFELDEKAARLRYEIEQTGDATGDLGRRLDEVGLKLDALAQKPFKEMAESTAGALTNTFQTVLQDFMHGVTDVGESVGTTMTNLGQSLVQNTMQPMLDSMQKGLQNLLQKAFMGLGKFGSTLAGGLIGGALVGVGHLLSGKYKNETEALADQAAESVVDSTEKVRGLIAGRTDIPVQQLNQTLEGALRRTNELLGQIRSDTSQMVRQGGGTPAVAGQGLAPYVLGGSRV